MQKLCALTLQHSLDWYPCPLGNDLRNILSVNLLLEHLSILLDICQLRRCIFELFLETRDDTVA